MTAAATGGPARPFWIGRKGLHANRPPRGRAAIGRANRPVLSRRMRPSVFVGREAELAVLAELAERAGANQPQAALIEGEAGIGKSSLLAKLGASLGDAKVLRASGAEDESHLAYGLVGADSGGRPGRGRATVKAVGQRPERRRRPALGRARAARLARHHRPRR